MNILEKIINDDRSYHGISLGVAYSIEVIVLGMLSLLDNLDYYINDEIKYITPEEALEKNLLKKNPTKEELLQAVSDNPNITDEFKPLFEKYIEYFERKAVGKAILYENIKSLKAIKIISKEEMKKEYNENTVMCFDRYSKFIGIREDKFEKYKKYIDGIGSIENRDSFENFFFHELTHLTNLLTVKDKFGRLYDICFFKDKYDKAILEQMTEDISQDIFNHFIDQCSYLYENMELLKIIVGMDEYNEIFYYDSVNGLREILEEKNEDLSVDRFIKLSYKQQKIYNKFKNVSYLENFSKYTKLLNKKNKIDLELYKMYIDHLENDENLEYYLCFRSELEEISLCSDVECEPFIYLEKSYERRKNEKVKIK